MYPSSRSSRTFFSRADNGNSERVNSGPNRAPKLHAHLKAFPGIITWPSGKHVRTRGVRARGERTALYSSGDPSSTPKNSSMRSRGRGEERKKEERREEREEEGGGEEKKKKQYDDGMPRPVQRPGCLRLPVIPMYRILLLLQYAVVFEIMAALSPNPTSPPATRKETKNAGGQRCQVRSLMIYGACQFDRFSYSSRILDFSIEYTPFSWRIAMGKVRPINPLTHR